MEVDLTQLVQNLNTNEINVLLKLYYNKDGIAKGFNESDFEAEILHSLIDKSLILTNLVAGESIVSLTDEGLNVCGSVMFNRVNDKNLDFKTEIQSLPERTIACLVNRVMWRDVISKENGFIDDVTQPYTLDESMWYERVILKDGRIANTLEKFYNILEELDFVQNNDGQRWCSPEVEDFLREEYKDIMDLTWTEEDSLKYYYFFYVYAQDQKNLIDFTGDGEEFRSMFFGEDSMPHDYWFSSNRSDPRMLLSSLGISEKRLIGFLEDMQKKDIVNERYYPLSSLSFFSDNDIIYVIKDIKSYMDFITSKFLTSVVDSLLT